MNTITSKPAYLTIIFPPSGLTMVHLQDNQLDSHRQIPVTVNSMYILPNTHFYNYVSDHGVNQHVYTTEELSHVIDSDFSRIVADDPKTEPHIGYNRNNLDQLNQVSDTQDTIENFPLRQMILGRASSNHTSNTHNKRPQLWIGEKKNLIVSCHTSPSKPATTIQWHLAGTLLIPNSDRSPDHQNFISHHYTLKEQIINVSDKSLLSRKDESILFRNASSTTASLTDEVQMQITQSQLTLLVERKYQHWQLECSVSNSEDFVPAKLPTVTVTIEPMYIENVKIRIVNETEHIYLQEGQLVHFECMARTNPTTPIYSWTIGNPIPSVDIETFSQLMDSQSAELNDHIDDKHEHSLTGIQMNASILQLTVNRAMHQKRIRCWVGVETPELLEKITNASLHGVLLNKDSTCESDCRQLRNSLRKIVKDMIWAKGDYRLEVTYGPEFSLPTNDILSGELGQTVTLECSANSNPESDVSLYYIGPEGQVLLEELTKAELTQYDIRQNVPMDSKHPKYVVWNSETEHSEFNMSVMKTAIHSNGRKLLGSELKHVSRKLHLTNYGQFGFYACIAQTTGYPPIYRTVYVGQAASPKILKIDQLIGSDGTFAKLFCTIYSIPRPSVHQITWSKNGIALKPDKRLRIYQEKTHRGVASVLTLKNLRPNDFSTYNCTVVNDHGTDWKLITLTSDNKWPLIFAIISGFAALLAALFVTVLCCFIKYTRMKRSSSSSKSYCNSKRQTILQDNKENKQIKYGVELKPMLKCKSLQSDQSNSDPAENIILTNYECYPPVQTIGAGELDIVKSEKDIGKCTSHDLNAVDLSTNFIEENYLNFSSCTYPHEIIPTLSSNVYSTNHAIISCTNHQSINCNQQPFGTTLVDNQFNTVISNSMSSPFHTSESLTNIIPNMKQLDITSTDSTKPCVYQSNDFKNSISPQSLFPSFPNNSTSLGPIFLMTSDLNYSTGICHNPISSNSATVLIPPVILQPTNEQTFISHTYNSMLDNTNVNTSVVFNTNSSNISSTRNNIPDISIIPFNVNNYQPRFND
ncbi:unnamed protein product [Schistosoma turkestanicum]|nr:unnamed protein product [Schistosoma turkestanicum]